MTTSRFAHPALLYRGPAEYEAGTVAFIRAALEADEPVAVAVPGPNLALIERALIERALIERAPGGQARRVELLDMTEAGRNPGRIIPAVLLAFANRHAPRPVRIIGEPIWAGRTDNEYPACVQHEALINQAFAGRHATILCPYDVGNLDERAIVDAARTHPVLIDSAGERPSPAYAPQSIIDSYNLPLPRPDGQPSHSYRFDADNLVAARRYAATRARHLGLPDARVGDVELAVAELANNSVRHGAGRGVLDIWTSDGHIVCQVRDTGTLVDPLAGRRPVPAHKTGGRGLLLVNRIADLVRVHATANGTTIRAHFRLSYQ